MASVTVIEDLSVIEDTALQQNSEAGDVGEVGSGTDAVEVEERKRNQSGGDRVEKAEELNVYSYQLIYFYGPFFLRTTIF